MEDNSRKRLYDKLSESYNLGTFEEFDSKMGNDSSRRALYDKVTEKYDIGTFEEFNAKMGNTHKQNLDAFNSQYGSFMNDFESRDTAETKMSRAGMSSGLVVPAEGSISGEERQKYLELYKQEEALKKAWYNSPDYLAQKDADALLLSQMRDDIQKARSEYAAANPMQDAPSMAFVPVGAAVKRSRGEADKEMQMFDTASRIMDDVVKLHNAPSKYDGKNAFLKFGKGSVDTLSDVDFWSAGLTEIADNFGVRDVLNSVQSKLGNLNDLSEEAIEDILSPAEKAVLQAWALHAQEQVNRKDDLARAYQAGQSATESLGFMAEFALTGGVGKATSEGVEAMTKWLGRKVLGQMDDAAAATVREMGEKIAKSTVGKYGARLADALAETAGKTLVMPSTFRNISEKAAEIQEDAEGNRYLTRMNDAFAKGFTDSFIENLSEGGRVNAIGDLIGDVAGKIPAYKKIVDKFANSKAGELLTAFNSSGIMNTLRAGGWHGFGEEYLEEWYGNALRTITGLDKDALKDFATVDNQLITITSFLPMTIFGGTVSTAQVLSAKKGLDKKAEMLRSALLERGYDEKQADNMIDMMRGASPAEISQTLTPIINAVALRDLNEAAALMKPVGEFAEAVRRWQSFDTKYQYQEQEQRDNLRTQMEETLGQFWQEDENGRQTVQRGVNANGEVVYLLGKPSAADAQSGTPQQVAAITSDGRKVFVDPSAVQLEGELEMNDFLGTEIMAEKGNKEQARMVEEKERALAQVRQMSAPGTTINLGTTEAPVVGTVTQRTPDGVVITMQDGTARQVSYEELGNYVGVNTTPLTDAQMDERDADALSADRAQREAELDMEYENLGSSENELTEAEAEVEQAVEAATPLPTKADGSVDQTALWNTDPARWAQWNDEQRQDDGAHTASFLLKNIQKLRNDIMALNAEREANLDPEAEAQFDAQIDAARDRMASLINVFEKYVPSDIAQQMILGEQTMPTQTGTAPAATSEQTAQQKPQTEDERRKPLRQKAKELSDKLGVKVNIAESLSDVKEESAREQILRIDVSGSSERATGWYNPTTGEVTIYLPHTTDTKEIEKTIVHEVVAHKGLRGLLGQEGFNVLCDSVWEMMTEEERQKYLAYPGVNGNKRAAADEYIAHYAETLNLEESKPVWDRIMDLIVRILNSMGVRLDMSREQLSDIIVASYQKLVKEASGQTEATQATELSGTQLTSNMNAPTSSEGKVTNNIETDNIEEEINPAFVEVISTDVAEQGTIMDMANQDDSAIRFSIKTEDYLEEQIRAYANSAEGKKAGWTEEKIESIIKETRDLINAIHNSNSGNEFYDDFAVKDPTIRLDWRDGVDKPIVTWTRANIEYKYDMSADLLCINNEGLEAVLSSDKMVALMEMFIPEKKAKKGEPVIKFTADDYLELYNTLKDLGFVVPCKGCFDAAGRFKMLPSVAQKFAAEVNAVIAERNKDPKKFDEKLKAQSGEKTASGLPATSATKSAAIAVGVAGDNLTEPIKWTQLMSADGQTKMLSDWGGIFRAWQRTGAGRPKDKLLPEPYYGDIVSSHTTIIGAYGESTPSFRDILVNTGTGLRRNSHSEFRPVLAVDEIQFMRDAFIRNLTVFKYMKELDDVRLFGKMGVKYNMSFFPEFVPGTKAAGLDLEGNYIASEESVGSREFPYLDERGVKHYDGMKGFEEAQKHINKDVSLSSVILSIPHLLKALTDVPTPSDARGVWGSLIPFHSSGATTSSLAAQGLGLARANGVGHGFEEAMYDYGKGVTNFEAVQNDRFGKGWEIISGKKAGTKVEEGHKLEFANGTHYYNRDLGVHLFASGYILDSELPEGALMENGDLNIDAEQKKSLMHKFKVDYNDKVRDLGTPYAYKEAADFYLSELPKIGLIPRFDFTVEESVFLQMCADANVDPRHPKLGWKGEGHGWSPIDSEAYYSLFCDFGMTDPATGEWSPHNPVGVVNENGEREFRLPENTVEIVREGLERFSEVRRTESGKIDEAIRTFAERSVEKGRISKADAETIVGELRMRVSSPSGAIDLVEEARKADLRHRMSSENTLVPGHKKGQPMLSDAEMMADAVSFRITKNTRATIESWCDKAGLDEDIKIGFVDHLEFTFDDATEQLCAAKWYLSGKINLPNEDEYKVRDAVKVAKRNKVDALSYESPMDILNTFGQPKEKVKPINPDNVPTLKNRTEVPGTDIVIYDVEESEESRENMREIINTHYGKNASPWCLLQGNEDGKLTKLSAEYWQRYSAYPKKVAFKGGRLLAFSANSSKEITWWDRQDHPYNNIPITQSLNDEKKRKQTVEINPKTGKEVRRSNIFSVANEDGYTIRRNWNKIDGPMVSAQKIKDGQVKALFNRYTKDDFATAAQYLLFGRPKGLDQVYTEEKSYAFGYNGALEFYNTLGYKVSYTKEAINPWSIITKDSVIKEYTFNKRGKLVSFFDGSKTIKDRKSLAEVEVPAEFQEIVGRDPKSFMADAEQLIIDAGLADAYKESQSDVSFRITPEQDKAYMDAVEAGDMETAQRMVDEAAEAAGYTIRGDHGRVSKFTIFDRDKANPEGNWGQGFYFTNNEEDVENNYASVEGPDLEAKIEREVERRVNLAEMNEEFNEDGEVDEFAIREAVEDEFITSEPNVVHAAIKMDNPFVVGHGMVEIGEDGLGRYDMQETYLTAEYETDEDGEVDYSIDPTGTLVDLVEALNDELSEYEGVNINAYDILSDNIDGMTASQFEKEARELLENSADYLLNDDLAIMTSEIIRAAIERVGFDGIVDNTVNQKFGTARRFGRAMEGVDENTRHYIAFQSNQIKETDPVTYDNDGKVIPLSERFNPENDDIRFSIIGERGAMNDKTEEGLTRLANLDMARQMESELNPDWSAKNDENALKIKVATGWERGADGKWRYEVDDVQIKPAREWIESKKKLTLKDIVEKHPIFDIYPDLLDIKIVKDRSKYNLGAHYVHSANEMKLPVGALKEEYRMMMDYYGEEQTEGNFAKYWKVMETDILHELQHAIQSREGFAKGGSPSGMLPEDWATYNRMYDEMTVLIDEYNKILPYNRLTAWAVDKRRQAERAQSAVNNFYRRHRLGEEMYRRLAGEVEAYNTKNRRDMSPEERRNSLLASTEDVAREDQIFIMEAIEAAESSVRFRVVDTTKAELKEKPIKMNGAHRFKLKSAFKGIKDSSGQFGYVTTQIHVGNETMEDPYRVRFDGSLEGYAVIYIRPDLAKITEDEDKEHTFYLDPMPIKDALWEALKAAENYYEAKYAQGPWAKFKNPGPFGYADWQNADKDSESSIRFRTSNENQAIFVSNAAKAVEGIKQEKATPEQWLKMIEKNGGLKAGEDKWMGLSEWLKASDKKTLTKQEVLDYIHENMIQIEEQHYLEDIRIEAEEQKQVDAMDDEFKALKKEAEENGENHIDAAEIAYQLMAEKYGDDFTFGFGVDNGHLYVSNLEAAASITGIQPRPERYINETRLNYTTSGLENPREIALTIPTIESWNESDDIHFGDAGDGRAVAWIRFGETTTSEKAVKAAQEYHNSYSAMQSKYGMGWEKKMTATEKKKAKEVDSSINEEGERKKVLVIDEIQSKRHQEGREKGYRVSNIEQWLSDNNVEVVESGEFYEFIKNGETDRRFSKGLMNYDIEKAKRLYVSGYNKSDIPDAPFDKNWHELAMKRMLRYAAENGYDVIAWTKGDQQTERYGLGGYVSSIEMMEEHDGIIDYLFYVKGREESSIVGVEKESGLVALAEEPLSQAEGKPLSDLVGKEMAVRMMQMQESEVLEGANLQIGGEGMRGFYDKMLPAFMNKYGKRWGVKVEDIDLPNLENGLTMHSIPVTEEMKASVMEGQVMFRMRGENESARDFVQSVTSEMQYAYPSIPTINVEDVTPEVAKKYGYTFDELKETSGLYLVDDKLIIIFAHEDIENEYQVKGSVYHESTHWVIKTSKLSTRIGKFFWDNADRTEFFKELKDFISETYDEKDWHEEMMCFVLSGVMVDGAINETKVALPQALRDDFSIILNNIGYGRERKRSRITWKNTPAKDGGKSTTEKGMGLETDKGQWNIEKGLTAEERRIIREYFPTFGESDVRMRVNSHGKDLTEGQQEFFANSKAVDKDGNLLVLYHGTPRAGFTEFKSGFFTTSKEDAISYSGDRKGRLFDPNEKYEPETLTAGDFRLGYMTFDSEADRAAFLERFPYANEVMSEREYEETRMGAEDEEYDALTARRKEFAEVWNAYREYERERFVDTTIGDLLANPEAYTEEDLMRAMMEYDSNASFDNLDDMSEEERRDALVSALQNANEEAEGGILDMVVPTRVPRNGEGQKHNDLGNRTYEVYANIERPYEIDANGRGSEFVSGDVYRAIEDGLASEEYDGVIVRNWRTGRHQQLGDVVIPKNGSQIKLTSNENPTESSDIQFRITESGEGDIRFSIRTKPAPKNVKKAVKLFNVDEKGNPHALFIDGSTSLDRKVWLDADSPLIKDLEKLEPGYTYLVDKDGNAEQKHYKNKQKSPSKAEVEEATANGSRYILVGQYANGKKSYHNWGINGSGQVSKFAMRPGWHLTDSPSARHIGEERNPDKKEEAMYRRPNQRWFWVEYAADVDYNEEAASNPTKDIQTHIPEDGYYSFKTNTNANDVNQNWIISGSIRILDPLSREEVRRENEKNGVPDDLDYKDEVSFRVTGTPTEDVVAEGVSLSPAQLASLAGDIFAALPEDIRKKITDGLNGNILGLQNAILQIPTSLAAKEEWNDKDRQIAEVVAEQMTKAVGKEMTRPFSTNEALWTLYNAVNKPTDLVSEASRALVRRNLGFDSQTLEKEKAAEDGVRFRTVGNASANAQASMYNRGAANVWTRLKESFVDMHASVEKLVKAIEKASGKVAEGFENVLMALNQQSSKGLAAMEAYEQKFLNKMFDEIRAIMDKTDFKYEDIVRYVILKHGLERNEKMAQRDAREFYRAEFEQKVASINADQSLTDAQKQALIAAAQQELDSHLTDIDWKIDAKFMEFREKDYSGISSMFYDTLGVSRKNYATEEEYQAALMQAKQDKYATLADIEAAAMREVANFETLVNTDSLWDSINKATKEILRQQYEANMISKDQYETLRDMYQFYVPLRGFADNTAEDMYTYYRQPNSSGYTKPILGAEGRKTEAESPFGWIAAMAGSAIASNVKNEAKLALYYFVANRPDNGIATLSRTWYEFSHTDPTTGKKVFKPAYPPFTEDLSSDAAKAAYEQWQEDMRQKRAAGLAYESGQRLNLGNAVVNISDTNKPEHIVNVKIGGKDYTIIINGNPRAAQAINGDLNIESSSQDYSSLFGPVLRWMSSVNTSYNPEFWITNMMRDMAFTWMAVNIKEDPAYRRKFRKNYMKAFKVISMVAKNEKGTLGSKYLEQMYQEFVKYGGVTGYTQIKDNETWEKEIENYLKSNAPGSLRNGKIMKGTKRFFHGAHRFGESLEQISRFAAFLTSREMGKSTPEAINDAKEITVNFNRKGSGKMITLEEAKYLTDRNGQPLNKFEQWMAVGLSSIAPLGRRFIMFFNAAIQGLNATYKLWKKNKARSIGWALGYMAFGVMNAVVHAMVDDDDDYLDMPQYERRNSLMLGFNGVYVKWALPQEARAFYALGDLAVESIMGRNPHQNVVGEALKISTEILPINPSEGWKAFMPSAAIPAVELLLNEDYKGDPIYNEQKWLSEEERSRTAKWSKAYQGTGKLYVNIAKGLNAVTGGDEHDAGLINIQPEQMEHIVQSAFGGTIRTADKFVSTIMAAIDPDEDVTIRQFPFLNRILTLNDERFKNVHVNDVFDYYKADAEHALTLEKQYKKNKDRDALDKLRDSDEYQWAKIYNKYKKPLDKIQEKIKVADGTAERKELMQQQDELKRQMIKEISEL